MKKIFFAGLAGLFLAFPVNAQNVKLTLECGSPDGATCTGGKHLAEVAAAANVAAIVATAGAGWRCFRCQMVQILGRLCSPEVKI